MFRGPLFHNPVTGQEQFFAVSYSKPALPNFKERLFSQATNFGLEEYHFPHNFLDHLIEPAFVQQHTLTLTPWKVNGLPNSHFNLEKVKWYNIK